MNGFTFDEGRGSRPNRMTGSRPAAALLRVAALALVLQLAACGGELTAREHIDKALDHKSEGEFQSAVIEFRNALQAEPRNAEARLLLGRTYLDLDELEAAEKELRRALELGAPRERVVLDLGTVLLRQGASADVLDQVTIVSNWSPELQARAHGLRGRAYIQMEDMLGAHEELRQAEKLHDPTLQAHLGRIELALAGGHVGNARDWAQRATETFPDSLAAWRARRRVAFMAADLEAAEDAADRAVELAAAPMEDHLFRARLRVTNGDLEGARADVSEVGGKFTDHPRVRFVHGLIAWAEEDFDTACTEMQNAVSDAPEFLEARFYLGVCQFRGGELNQAQAHLNWVNERSPAPEVGRVLGAVRLALGQAEEAREVVRPLVQRDPDDAAALELLGRIELQLGNSAEAVEYLYRLSELKPGDADVSMRLGAGLVQSGELDAGRAALGKALELDPGSEQAGAMLVLSHIRAGEHDEALDRARKLADQQPDSPFPWTLVALAHVSAEDKAAAREALGRALERDAADPAARQFLARLDLEDGEIESARGHLETVLEEHPDHTRTIIAMAELEAAAGNRERVEELLLRAYQADPDAMRPRVLLARLRLERGKPADALDILTDANGQLPSDFAALEIAGRAHLELGQPDRAIERLERLIDLDPTATGVRLLLAKAHAAAGNADAAIAQVDRELEAHPENVEAQFIKARALALVGRTEEAGELIAGLPIEAARLPHVLATRALLATRAGNPAQAALHLEQLQAIAPSGDNVIELARTLRRAGEPGRARTVIESWLDQHPGDAAAWLAAGDLRFMDGDEPGAIEAYRAALDAAPDSAQAMNNLAWLLRNSEPDEALRLAQQAVKTRPETPALRDTLGMVRLARGESEAAIRDFRTALDQAPDSAQLRHHLAQALAQSGRREEARALLRDLFSQGRQFPGQEEARQLLESLEASS